MSQASLQDLDQMLSFLIKDKLPDLHKEIMEISDKFVQAGGSQNSRKMLCIGEACERHYKTICTALVECALTFGTNESMYLEEISPVLDTQTAHLYNEMITIIQSRRSDRNQQSVQTIVETIHKDLHGLRDSYLRAAQKGYLNGKKVFTPTGQPAKKQQPHISVGFEALLHPVIVETSLEHYSHGRYRDAVLNGITSVFDLIRERTGLTSDGFKLADQAFHPEKAVLVIADLSTESGHNEQTGFINMLKGAYQGIRNPKAHSLQNNLSSISAGQYLVFISLLAQKVSDATVVGKPVKEEVA